MKVNFDAIPSQMKTRPQWIVWKEEMRNGRTNKTPYQLDGSPAASDDPATWARFDDIAAGYDAAKHSGVGFVFSDDDPFFGIDLDACLFTDGTLTRWAEEVLRQCPTYAEVSPSGFGLKLIGIGDLPTDKTGKTFRKDLKPAQAGKMPEIALWKKKRYFAITGHAFSGFDTIENCPNVTALWQRLFGGQPSAATSCPPNTNTRTDRVKLAVAAMARMDMQDGQDGSRRLYAAACRCVGFDLSDPEALQAIASYNIAQPFPRQWTDGEILQRVHDAESDVRRGEELQKHIDWTERRGEQKQPPRTIEQAPEKIEFRTTEQITLDYLDKLDSEAGKLYRTGIGELDTALIGGIAMGEVVVLAARPSHGKSAVALQFAHSFNAQGLNSLFVSEEMTADQIGKRTAQFISPLDQTTWLYNRPEITEQVREHYRQRGTNFVVSNAKTAERTVELIRYFHAEHDVRVVAVDYLQRLSCRGGSEFERVTNASKMLSTLAKELNIIIVLLCQLNRGIEGRDDKSNSGASPIKIPKSSDIRQSGQIEQDADVVVFCVWPKMFDPNFADKERYIFSISKNRERGIDNPLAVCKFNPARQRVQDPDVEDHPNYYDDFAIMD